MKQRLVLLALAILLLSSGLSVLAQDTPTPTPDMESTPTPDVTLTPVVNETPVFVETPGVLPTADPNACFVNFFTTTRQGVSARYYNYLSKWMLFSLAGATGSVTLNSQEYGFTLYLGKMDFTAGTFGISTQVHVDAGVDYAFTVDTLNAPHMGIVFDCTGDLPIQEVDATHGTLALDLTCAVLSRPRVNLVSLPSMYTFGHVYIMPIYNTAGSLTVTSTIQSFSTLKVIQVESIVGEWFEDLSSGVARGIREGNVTYTSDPTSTSGSYVTTATINAGDTSHVVLNCS